MSNYRRGARLAAIAAVGALALAACGGGDGGESGGTGAAEFNAAVTGVVNPSDATGGTLNLGSGGDCDSWDPGRQYYGWCLNMGRLYYRTLMAYKPVPGEDGFDLVPDLAQAPGEANADKTVWTYHLRPDLTYEDGTPITTKDIKYAIKRLYATGVINGGPGLMMIVEKLPWANTLDVTRGVDEALAALKPGLHGVDIDAQIFRPATFIELALHNLASALLIGCLLVIVVLGAFLYEWRAALTGLDCRFVALRPRLDVALRRNRERSIWTVEESVLAELHAMLEGPHTDGWLVVDNSEGSPDETATAVAGGLGLITPSR